MVRTSFSDILLSDFLLFKSVNYYKRKVRFRRPDVYEIPGNLKLVKVV